MPGPAPGARARADHADARHPRHDRPAAGEPSRRAGRRCACSRSPACADDGPPAVAPDVEVRAAGCSLVDELSSGIVVADGRVLTAAHGLRGADGGDRRRRAGDGRRRRPPHRRRPHRRRRRPGPPVAIAADVAPGRHGSTAGRSTVERLVVAAVEEPRDDATYRRQALVLDGDVGPGDSGSGVVRSGRAAARDGLRRVRRATDVGRLRRRGERAAPVPRPARRRDRAGRPRRVPLTRTVLGVSRSGAGRTAAPSRGVSGDDGDLHPPLRVGRAPGPSPASRRRRGRPWRRSRAAITGPRSSPATT